MQHNSNLAPRQTRTGEVSAMTGFFVTRVIVLFGMFLACRNMTTSLIDRGLIIFILAHLTWNKLGTQTKRCTRKFNILVLLKNDLHKNIF